jgi:hypothetical protein
MLRSIPLQLCGGHDINRATCRARDVAPGFEPTPIMRASTSVINVIDLRRSKQRLTVRRPTCESRFKAARTRYGGSKLSQKARLFLAFLLPVYQSS